MPNRYGLHREGVCADRSTVDPIDPGSDRSTVDPIDPGLDEPL